MSAVPFKTEGAPSAKLRSFANKYVRDPPTTDDGTKIPAPKNDIFERMDLGHKLSQDNSIDDTVDVFPDTRYPLKYIIYNVMKLYKTLDQERPLLSPSSFVAYCMFQLYAFALINDAYGRPHPSFPANDFLNADSRSDLLDAFCNSFCAPFMLTLFQALTNTSDPRRPGLQYFCTLAGSRFSYDFGRYIPPQMFIFAHNMSCEADTSRNVQAAMEGLINSDLFTQEASGMHIKVGNYLSSGMNATSYYASWLYEAVKTLFSPVTGKSLLRRSNIESVDAFPIEIHPDMEDDSPASNQYILFLNADRNNVYATSTFVTAFSNIIQHAFPTSVMLGSVPDSLSGLNILVHGYSSTALPTWHTKMFKKDDTIKLSASYKTDTYAKSIKFLQETTFAKKAKAEYPDDSKKNWPKALLLLSEKEHDPKKNPDTEITFDPELHEFPRVQFLDPYTNGDGPVSYAMLAGLIIEFLEIDGSTVPTPHPEIGLAPNNRQFLQGSLPIHNLRLGLPTAAETAFIAVARTVPKSRVQKIAHALFDFGKHRAGQLDLTTSDDAYPTSLPNFDLIRNIGKSSRMSNIYALSSSSPDDALLHRAHAWSPYRFVSSKKEEHPQEKTTFVLFNHRALYGTHIPLVSTRHPSLVIPLS